MNKFAALTIVAAAVAVGSMACSTPVVEFPVYEGPGQEPGTVTKKLVVGGVAFDSELNAKLKANDVDGAIAVVDGKAEKDFMQYYILSVLYSVKHDWAKAEEAIAKAIDDYQAKRGGSQADLVQHQAWVQEYKAKFVR